MLQDDDEEEDDVLVQQVVHLEQTELQLTVLYGAQNGDPPCYLLEVSGCLILLDCGWNDNFDVKVIEPLRRVARDIDLVLITHANFEHAGALPYARRHFGLDAPVYATTPVIKMAHLALYDSVLACFPSEEQQRFIQLSSSRRHARRKQERFRWKQQAEGGSSSTAPSSSAGANGGADFETEKSNLDDMLPRCGYDLDDIDDCMTAWKELKYSQPLRLTGSGEGIVVTPYASGRTVGGAVWRIHRDQDDVLYVSDVNQKREHHLDGLDLRKLSVIHPTLLIADAACFNVQPSLAPRMRDAKLEELILTYLRAGGDVLMPVDSSGRVLELLFFLDSLWQRHRALQSYDLCFLTRISSVLDYASSHLEWMSSDLSKSFDIMKVNPFDLPRIKVVDQVEKIPSGAPKVILCSTSTLEGGYSQELFIKEFSRRADSLVLLTERPFERRPPGTAQQQQRPTVANQLLNGLREVTCSLERWVLLEGEELKQWQEEKLIKAEELERGRERNLALKKMESEEEPSSGTSGENDASGGGPASASSNGENKEEIARTTSSSASSSEGPEAGNGATGTSDENGEDLDSSQPLGGGNKGARMATESATLAPSSSLLLGMAVSHVFSFNESWKGKRWDEYGEQINEADYFDDDARRVLGGGNLAIGSLPQPTIEPLTKGLVSGAEMDDDEMLADMDDRDPWLHQSNGNGSRRDDEESVVSEFDDEPPRKRIVTEVRVPVHCRVEFVDVGGWVDGRSLVQIMLALQPKKLVAVRAYPRETGAFVSECKRIGACGIAMSPPPGECIDIASHSSVLSLKLAQETLQNLTPPVRVSSEWTVQRVSGYLADGSIQPNFSKKPIFSDGVFWITQGEPSLIKLKEALRALAGIESNFENGVLVCASPTGTVAVFRPPGGQIQISGPLCDLYFKVRETLYESCFTMV